MSSKITPAFLPFQQVTIPSASKLASGLAPDLKLFRIIN
jgi:hypothetical protein